MYFYNFGDIQVVGSSPEILVRQELREHRKIVTIRPLAGTRPRGKTPEHDTQLAKELLADPKEIAEHVMLIDLARNDVGRIAKTGTVKVTDSMVIEKYSHVQHIVSSVEGELKDNMSNMDVLRATFPAGTLSGAPKIRAMEIIDEMEIVKRGIYGGAAGYLSFSGDMDVAIVIRTGVIKDGMLHSQAGAGVVADSNPQSEWHETEAKAKAVLAAADLI
jgi:anthranilate synthase component 1